MKRGSTMFLRLAIMAIGAAVLAVCLFALPSLWMHVADEYPNHTYVFYGILSALYVATVPFFLALRQSLKLLSYIESNKAFSKLSAAALKQIAYCGVAIAVVFTAVMPLIYMWAEGDDAPGLILIWAALIGASLTVSVFAAVVQRLLGEVIAMKSENDLTV